VLIATEDLDPDIAGARLAQNRLTNLDIRKILAPIDSGLNPGLFCH
jgi:hypothetical protein